MAYCSASQAATDYDKLQSDCDDSGEDILKDAYRDGSYQTAVNKELATRLRLLDIHDFIVDLDLYDIPEDASKFYTIWRYSLAEAIADGNAHKVGSIFLEIFEPQVLELKSDVEDEFKNNPWKIERVLNDQ